MQIKSLRTKSYRSWCVDDTPVAEIVKFRLSLIEKYQVLRKEGCSEATALETLDLKRATFFRWQQAYRKFGRSGLEPSSKAPKHKRKTCWTKQQELLVLSLRKKFPLWGKKTLTSIMSRDHAYTGSESTVGRILTKLMKQGKIRPAAFYEGRVRVKKARAFKRHAKRWNKTVKRKQAGDLVQVDHMTVTVGSGFTIKHFKATCPITKITVSQVYTNASSETAAAFLTYVKKQLPFRIRSIQVDGGSEFMKAFELECEALKIPLYVLPPRSPELNGCVERCNRTFRYQFYGQYDGAYCLKELRSALLDFCHIYNNYRPHQALGQLTPMAYYNQHLEEAV